MIKFTILGPRFFFYRVHTPRLWVVFSISLLPQESAAKTSLVPDSVETSMPICFFIFFEEFSVTSVTAAFWLAFLPPILFLVARINKWFRPFARRLLVWLPCLSFCSTPTAVPEGTPRLFGLFSASVFEIHFQACTTHPPPTCSLLALHICFCVPSIEAPKPCLFFFFFPLCIRPPPRQLQPPVCIFRSRFFPFSLCA